MGSEGGIACIYVEQDDGLRPLLKYRYRYLGTVPGTCKDPYQAIVYRGYRVNFLERHGNLLSHSTVLPCVFPLQCHNSIVNTW